MPQDWAIFGFDEQPFADLMDLSTIGQPVADQALDVTTRLLAALASGDADLDDDVVLPTEVIVRGSTDPARTVY